MHINHIDKVEKEIAAIDGVKGAGIQWLIAEKEDADKFFMRLIAVEPGGIIPLHNHSSIHEIFIVKGSGAVLEEGGETPVTPGNFVYVKGDEIHGFKNTGKEELQFICCIDKPY